MGDNDAVARREPLEDRRLLEGAHYALARHDMRREARDDFALERHPTLGWLHERRDEFEDGRLPGAVRADDREDLVLLDVERDVVDRDKPAVALGQILDLDDRRHRAQLALRPRKRRLKRPFGNSSMRRIITPE